MQELTTYFALLNNDINGEFSFTPYTAERTYVQIHDPAKTHAET